MEGRREGEKKIKRRVYTQAKIEIEKRRKAKG